MKISFLKYLFTLTLTFLALKNSFAATRNWVGGTSTSWTTASNWNEGVVPVAGDVVQIAVTYDPNSIPIISSGTVTVGSIIFGGQFYASAGYSYPGITVNSGATLNVTGNITIQTDIYPGPPNEFYLSGGGSITAMQAVYVPADDMTDPAVVSIFATLDGVVVLSRDLVQRGMYPAIDPLQSSCTNLDTNVVGRRHYEVSQEVIQHFNKHNALKRIVAVIGLEELSKDDQKVYKRAEKLYNFMTQPFTVSEVFTGKKGEYVPLEDNILGCERILRGDYDHMESQGFYMIGKSPRI